MLRWALVIAGSAAGGAARYALTGLMARRAGAAFPWGTLSVNLLGCFAIGLLAGLGGRLSEETRLLLATGFCGGFTTFSAFILETTALSRPTPLLAALYVALSVAAGLTLFKTGFSLTR